VRRPVSSDQVVETVYEMQRATRGCVDSLRAREWMFGKINAELTVQAQDVIVDMYTLQVSLGILADFYGRDAVRSGRGDV